MRLIYNNILFRKLKFRRFVRTKQSEERVLNEIENKFLQLSNVITLKFVFNFGNILSSKSFTKLFQLKFSQTNFESAIRMLGA